MAAVELSQDGVVLYSGGVAERVVLYALKGITAGDTVDLSRDFDPPRLAVMIGATVVGALVVTVNGNSVAIPDGVNNDAAYLLVWGVHS